MSDFTIAKTANTRVFLIEGRARPDHAPVYKSCLRMMALSQGFGDIETVECPDPSKYGRFVERGQIVGANERPTTSLEGRYPHDLISDLLRLGRQGCDFDVQLHTGACQDPSSFDEYDKALILEGAHLTNYSTEDLGALASGDNAVINESSDISAKEAYEVVPLKTVARTPVLIVSEAVDVVLCDNISCGGDCEAESAGCEKSYAITKYTNGSPAALADFAFTLDGGATWFVYDLDTLVSQDPNAIECLGEYVVIVSNAAGSISYAPKTEMNGVTDPTFIEITTGFVAGAGPNDIWSTGQYAFIVGDNGYVYATDDPTAGVEVLDAGSATIDDLLCVHGLSSAFAVAGGRNGALIFANDGVSWADSPATPVGVAININCVWVKSTNEWWVGASNGRLYYTLDQGVTWVESTFSGSGTGSVEDIVFSTASVGYMSHTSATPKGRILKTINGGKTWKLVPEKTGVMPANDKINAIAYCETDPNFVIGVGLADDAASGFIVVGSD